MIRSFPSVWRTEEETFHSRAAKQPQTQRSHKKQVLRLSYAKPQSEVTIKLPFLDYITESVCGLAATCIECLHLEQKLHQGHG